MTPKLLVNLIDCTKRDGLRTLAFGSRVQIRALAEDIVVIVSVFMGKTLCSHSASLSTNVMLGGNPVIYLHHINGRRRNTPSRHLAHMQTGPFILGNISSICSCLQIPCRFIK